MKSKQLALIVFVACALAGRAPSADRPVTMSVQVRAGQLRSSNSFLGTIVADLHYGDRVAVLEAQGAWRQVRTADGSATGWIHESALTEKRIKLQAGEEDAEVAASSGELALAGKGFNSKVEAEFKNKNKDIDFTWVDKMEAYTVSAKQAQAFFKTGGVAPSKGGAQ